jgi:hypothetical protein
MWSSSCGATRRIAPLRELNASVEQVKKLVPRRPVETVTVFIPWSAVQDWFGEELGWSTAQVRSLRVKISIMNSPRMMEQVVSICPSLESLSLFVGEIVSGPLALLR